LTRINNDVKLIDLGFSYTDTFADTQGHTNDFAAPEQLSGNKVDVRSDIYAFGKVLEQLPEHYIYNKVIARCTTENPVNRYQSVDEILSDLNHQRGYFRIVATLVFVAALITVGMAVLTHQQQGPTPIVQEVVKDSVVLEAQDSIAQAKDTLLQIVSALEKHQETVKDEQAQFKDALDQLIDQSYRSTIACFCDSVFPSPSPTTGKSWADASTRFHNQTIQIAERLSKEYPNIPEATICQEAESRFQSLVSYIFNQMRNNDKQ